jgi:hypothetical protein
VSDGNIATAYDRSDNDDFWRAKLAEAKEAGGSIEVDLADIPPVPGVAICLPSGEVTDESGGKWHIEGCGPVKLMTDMHPGWVDDDPEHPAMATSRLRVVVPEAKQ